MIVPILHIARRDKRIAQLIKIIGNIQMKEYDDPFRFLVGEIAGQMLSNKVRNVIIERLEILCNNKITPNTILSLNTGELRNTGMSFAKINYIQNLASLVVNHKLDFNLLPSLSDDEIIKLLTSIKGIGNWTAKMYLLFFLQREDILPYEDGAFLQAYKWLYNTKDTSPESVMKKCSKWHPYSSFCARYLYIALDSGMTKEKFVLR